jgi:hypothetical protein
VKKAGCILVLFLPAILYIYYCYSRATRFESAGNQERRLAMQAAAQVAGEQAAVVSCRSVASNSTQQSESVAWWSVDFECRWPGDTLPNRTSVSVRLAKKTLGWTVD